MMSPSHESVYQVNKTGHLTSSGEYGSCNTPTPSSEQLREESFFIQDLNREPSKSNNTCYYYCCCLLFIVYCLLFIVIVLFQISSVQLLVQRGHTHLLHQAPPMTTPHSPPPTVPQGWKSLSCSYQVYDLTPIIVTPITTGYLPTAQAPPPQPLVNRALVSLLCHHGHR